MAQDGSQVRAVAKGARKPSSTFSSRLELFSNVSILLAKGKNLDIVREAKLINPFMGIRSDVEKMVCASPAMELIEKVTLQNHVNESLYPMTLNFLSEVESMNNSYYLKALCAAHLIKTCSIIGFRPSLVNCVVCNDDISELLKNDVIKANFSIEDGGVVCLRCSKKSDTEKVSTTTLNLVHKLIHAKFDEIMLITVSEETVDDALYFCKNWILYHIGTRMKSLSFYLKNI